MIGGCQGTEFGCCCDKITPAIDASQSNCIGGCCGTEFGCCPYSTEAKKDSQGSNCGTIQYYFIIIIVDFSFFRIDKIGNCKQISKIGGFKKKTTIINIYVHFYTFEIKFFINKNVS